MDNEQSWLFTSHPQDKVNNTPIGKLSAVNAALDILVDKAGLNNTNNTIRTIARLRATAKTVRDKVHTLPALQDRITKAKNADKLVLFPVDGEVGEIVVSANGRYMANAWIKKRMVHGYPEREACFISVWDLKKPLTPIAQIQTQHIPLLNYFHIAISADGSLVAACDEEGASYRNQEDGWSRNVYIWKVQQAQTTEPVIKPVTRPIALSFMPNNNLAIADMTDDGCKICVFDIDKVLQLKPSLIQLFPSMSQPLFEIHDRKWFPTLSHNGEMAAGFYGYRKQKFFKIWNLSTQKLVKKIPVTSTDANRLHTAFSWNNKVFAFELDNTIVVTNLVTGQTNTVQTHPFTTYSFALSVDGDLVAARTSQSRGEMSVVVWDVASGLQKDSVSSVGIISNSVTFIPNSPIRKLLFSHQNPSAVASARLDF